MKHQIIENPVSNDDLKVEAPSRPVQIPLGGLTQLPYALLPYIANFLDIADALPYFYSNRLLSEYPQRDYFRLKIHQFFPEDALQIQEIKRGSEMHQIYKKLNHEHYATLSPFMIQLFNLVKIGQLPVVIDQIKKLMIRTLYPKTDIDQFEKYRFHQIEEFFNELLISKRDRDGRTLISWLTALNPPGHQQFLDFLFDALILTKKENIFGDRHGTAITIRTSLQKMPKAKRMSLSILWLYALAFVCKQTPILKGIEGLPAWRKEFIGREGISLLTCAVLLDSKELFEYSTAGLTAASLQALLSEKCTRHIHLSSPPKVGRYHFNPWQLAAILESPAMINLLLQANHTAIYLPKPDYTGLLHLFARIRYGRPQMAATLIEYKADVEGNRETYGCGTPLLEAARIGNMDIVRLLVENKASANGTSELSRDKSLHYAVGGQHPRIVKYLVEQKADVNILSSYGKKYYTPLTIAISVKNIPIATYLLMVGAKIGPKELIMAALNPQIFYLIASKLPGDQIPTLLEQVKENIFKKSDNDKDTKDQRKKEKIWNHILNLFKTPGKETALPANHSSSMNPGGRH